ncbi:hypothetical protein RUM44_011046 [Polyplax serrata]|uniref:Uncharacterized protein n=1 Tax=Polyplax serrata TaxID=468196 RepID=A0ABR1ANW6_POLSC
MSSSEEDYGRTERPLPKPSHSAHSHGKNKYSETCGRASETSGTCNRYLDTGDGRISFQEGPSSASRYNEGGNKSYSHSCDGNRYSAPDSRSSSPRYNDQTNSRFSEATETVIRYPGESRGEPCRSSRYADSSGNTYLESSSKVGSYAEGRLPGTEGDIYPNESGGKYTTDRYHGSSSSPERNVEKYGKNEHFIHGEKSELAPERNGRCTVGTPGRHDRNSDRSNDKYYSERMSDRTERSHERSEKHADRIPEKYISNGDRYVIHNAQESGSTRGSDRYGASERNFDRYSEDYYQSTDRISSNDQLVESSDGYKSSDRTDGYRPDRFLCSTNVGDLQRFDGYCTLPSHSDKYSRKSAAERFENSRYLPPPAPAPSERYHPPERYIPPPAPSNDRFGQSLRERFLETPSKDRYQDRYIPTPAPDRFLPATYERFQSSTVNPGDPYMRRDLGYHHHYRLPHPNYHVHQQSYYHSQYQRTLPHRSLGSYHHQSVLPSPSRSQMRCCPSPNHYVQPDEITSGSSNSSHSSNVLTANITGSTMPVLAASLTNGQSLKSFSASVNVNIVTAQGTNPPSRDRDRDYLPPCPSPILLNSRGRPTSGNVTRMSSSHAESVGPSVGPNVGRHVSTPTPPPSLPRCSSLSSCELNGETTVCKTDHSHHHQYTPARRSCSGTMEPSTSLTVCCSSSRRTNSSALNLNNTVSGNQSSTSAMGHTNGSFTENMPKVPSFGTLSSSTVLENGRQGVAVSCVISNSTHSTVW